MPGLTPATTSAVASPIRYALPAFLALIPALTLALIAFSSSHLTANADLGAFRCTASAFYFPAVGLVGMPYKDPSTTDRASAGNVTIHTGVDIFGSNGDGSPIYAPADGFVSRQPRSDNLNLVLPNATNALTGQPGLEVYLTHI